MDVETVTPLERVNDRIDALEASVRGDIAQLCDLFSHQGGALQTEFREGLSEARRHAVMLNESTRDDIRLVAEAVAVLTVKVESLQR